MINELLLSTLRTTNARKNKLSRAKRWCNRQHLKYSLRQTTFKRVQHGIKKNKYKLRTTANLHFPLFKSEDGHMLSSQYLFLKSTST